MASGAVITNTSEPRPFPRPRLGESFANVLKFRRDPLGALDRAAARGDVATASFLGQPAVVVNHPDLVRHVLIDAHGNYDKKTRGFAALRMVLGDGLLTSEGSFWRRQRRIAAPAFHKGRIANFAETIVALTDDTADSWRTHAGEPFDVAASAMALTLRIIGKTMLSTDVLAQAGSVGPALTDVLEYANDAISNPLLLPLWVPTPRNRQFNRGLGLLDGIIGPIIAARRAADAPGDDLLGMLLAARDEETGEGMSDQELRDEVMTIFLAGHETTANLLAWTSLLLADHPEVDRRLASELDAALAGKTPSMADLPRLPYLRAILNESMRLYPPAWIIARRSVEAATLGEQKIPRHTLVFVAPWTLHRDRRWFDEPLQFRPERFLPGAEEPPRGAYFPFGMGPRVCIGKELALLEAQLVLARLAQSFRMERADAEVVVPEPLITLRPRGGLRLRAVPR